MQKSRHLIFTSVGDHHALEHWTRGKKDFDLWVAHYGNKRLSDSLEIDFLIELKGAKFPNFKYFYNHYRDILEKYDSIALLDDDLIISASEINALFAIRKHYDLWVLQPAFSVLGKISHLITQEQESTLMRLTNFVEVTCPFFQTDKLLSFMAIYDPILVGFGIDWWYLHHFQAPKDKLAIIDAITCINPFDSQKSEGREIDRLQSLEHRKANWRHIKEAYKLKNEGYFVDYGSIPNRNNKEKWLEFVGKSLHL